MNEKKIFSLIFLFISAAMQAADGISLYGDLKYNKNQQQVEYANPKAPQGGEIVLGWLGAFDTLNPFAPKGTSPLLIGSLVHGTLGEGSLDEPFSKYPSIAKSFKLGEDNLSLTIELDPEAKFSDGKPITADDVLFSFELMRSEEVPSHFRSYWSDVDTLEKVNSATVIFKFKRKNPELAGIITELTILPKHFYKIQDFGKSFYDKILGAGPYVVEKYKLGSFVTYKKNPNFWGENKLLNKGRYNFERITIKYYQDQAAQLEGFKKGDFDFLWVLVAKVWAQDLTGEKFDKKLIRKDYWSHENNRGGQGFFFNMRRSKFADVRVRKAIALAFDFQWTNSSLFYKQYIENTSFFENSVFKAHGFPTSNELQIFEALAKKHPNSIPEDLFKLESGSLGKNLPIKARLKQAYQLLLDAGYSLGPDRIMADKAGNRLVIDFLISSPAMQRIIEPFATNLKTIGILLEMNTKEGAVHEQKLLARDFDMVVLAVGQSQSPGNEQKGQWGSASADEAYSSNHGGVRNPAVDELIEKIIYAESREEQILYTKLLDRVLYHLHIAVHNWHSEAYWVSYWDKFDLPKNTPKFYNPLSFIEYMWRDKTKTMGN